MDKINAKKVAISLAIVSAALYLACAALIFLAPEFAMKIFSSLFHGIDISKIADKPVSLSGVLIGLAEIVIYSLIAGWLFAVVYNKIK